MIYATERIQNRPLETRTQKDFEQIAEEVSEKALNEAKAQLHPLIRHITLDRLGQRQEFVSAFRLALERGVAEILAAMQPEIQAVFQFDDSWLESRASWDGSIHLLVKVSCLSEAVKVFAKKLDHSLVCRLRRLGWSLFQKKETVLDVQQVTTVELRHGISYGAMFCAVYSLPVRVWPHPDKGE